MRDIRPHYRLVDDDEIAADPLLVLRASMAQKALAACADLGMAPEILFIRECEPDSPAAVVVARTEVAGICWGTGEIAIDIGRDSTEIYHAVAHELRHAWQFHWAVSASLLDVERDAEAYARRRCVYSCNLCRLPFEAQTRLAAEASPSVRRLGILAKRPSGRRQAAALRPVQAP